MSFELMIHSMDAPSVAARGPVKDLELETIRRRCPLCPQLFVIKVCCCFTDLFFREAAFTTVELQWMFYYFGTQSTMQGEGWGGPP